MPGQMNMQQAMELASEHHAAGRLAEAEQICRQVLIHQPNHAEAMHLMAMLAMDRRQIDVALDWLNRAVEANPNAAIYHGNRGLILAELDRAEEAIASLRQALSLQPDLVELYSNLASVLMENDRFDEAVSLARQAVTLQPDYAEAWANLGMALRSQGKLDDALNAYRKAAEIRPDWAMPHYAIGAALMLRGDLLEAWKFLEWRRRDRSLAQMNWTCAQPQWSGSDIRGRTIFLHSEQGFGDTLQFVRYVPMVAARGAKVILGVPPELVKLMKDLPGVTQCVTSGQPIAPFDVYCPLMTLPMIFSTHLRTIPAAVPYLRADSESSSRWCKRVSEIKAKRKVGLAWAGRPSRGRNRGRSISLAMLSPLFAVPDVRFISLRKESDSARQSSQHAALVDWTGELTDFAETAALIDNLDLIITIDTAVAHLAGAMGKPVWLLLQNPPDWRWMLDRTDSPWYPSMRLFRQDRIGDWQSVIERVARELACPNR